MDKLCSVRENSETMCFILYFVCALFFTRIDTRLNNTRWSVRANKQRLIGFNAIFSPNVECHRARDLDRIRRNGICLLNYVLRWYDSVYRFFSHDFLFGCRFFGLRRFFCATVTDRCCCYSSCGWCLLPFVILIARKQFRSRIACVLHMNFDICTIFDYFIQHTAAYPIKCSV